MLRTLLLILLVIFYAGHLFAEEDLCMVSFAKKKYSVARQVCQQVVQTNPYAQYVMGELSFIESGEISPAALKNYLKAAERGVVEAQRRLGDIAQNGSMGSKNYAEARRWYKVAAEQNDSQSQLNLGLMYVNGRGGNKDSVEGLKWLTIAEQNGNTQSSAHIKTIGAQITGENIHDAQQRAADWQRNNHLNNMRPEGGVK